MHIEPLSQERLADTIKLAQNVFSYEVNHPPARGLKDSLQKELLIEHGLRKLEYFLLLDDQRKNILGLIGQYERLEDPPNIVWVGWFCIDPAYQSQKLGEYLLRWNMQNAREKGYTTMRLYTSQHPNERKAQGLYNKLDFQITDIQTVDNGYPILYRERQL